MPKKRSKSSIVSSSDRNGKRQVQPKPSDRFIYILKDERSRILKNLEKGLEDNIRRTEICETAQELTMVLLKLMKFKSRLHRMKQSHNVKHAALGKMIDIVRDDICSMIRRESVNQNEVELVSNRAKDIGAILQNVADEFAQDDAINVEIGPAGGPEGPVCKQENKQFSSDSCPEYSSFTKSIASSLSLSSDDEFSKDKKTIKNHLGNEVENKYVEYKLLNEITKPKKYIPNASQNLKSDTVVHTTVENNLKGSDSVNVIDKLFVDKETQDYDTKYTGSNTPQKERLNWISSEDQSKFIQKATSYDFFMHPGINWEKPKISFPLKKPLIDKNTWKYYDPRYKTSKCKKNRETNTAGGDYPSREACSQTEHLSSPFQPVYFLKVYYSSTSLKNAIPGVSASHRFPAGAVVVDSSTNRDTSAVVTCRADPEKGVAHFVLVQQGDRGDGVEILPVVSSSKLDDIRDLWVRKLKDICCEVKDETVICRSPCKGNARK